MVNKTFISSIHYLTLLTCFINSTRTLIEELDNKVQQAINTLQGQHCYSLAINMTTTKELHLCPTRGLTWNQMALTILLSTNRGSTQRALNTEVNINSSHDHTLPWREGSPGKECLFEWQVLPLILTYCKACDYGMNPPNRHTYQWLLLWESAVME